MPWRVESLNATVDTEIEALPEDIRARLAHIGQLIAEFGLLRIHEPYVKHLSGKLWEMRMSAEAASRGRSMLPLSDNERSFCMPSSRRRRKRRLGHLLLP